MQVKKTIRIVGGLGAAALLTAGLTMVVPQMDAAQADPQAQAQRVRPGGRGGRMGGPMAGGFGDVMRDLTEAQREQVKGIRERHAERLKPVVERSRAARAAIDAAVFSGNTGNLQALSIEVGNAETELAFAQAQLQAEIFGVLTAEQKQRVAEQRKEMEGRRGEMMKRRRGAV